MKKGVFLKALLEVLTTKRQRRSPLEWAGATALHVAILATLIIVPLYTTGANHLPDYNAAPLIAPPLPPPPAPPAATHNAMIGSFIYAASILGQGLYWSFLRYRTDVINDDYWKAHYLRFRRTQLNNLVMDADLSKSSKSRLPSLTAMKGMTSEA